MYQPKPDHVAIPDAETMRTIRADLEAAGFAVLPEFAHPGLLAALRAETHMLCAKADAELPGTVIRRDTDRRVMSLHYLDRHSDVLFDLIRTPEIQHFADRLLGSRSVPFLTEFFSKPVVGSQPTPPHQDQVFNREHFGDELAVTIWLALTDVDEQDAVLQYAIEQPPIGKLLDHHLSDVMNFDAGLVDDTSFTYISAPVPAGGAVLHHSYAVHRSRPMHGTSPRAAVALNWRRSPYREHLNPLEPQ